MDIEQRLWKMLRNAVASAHPMACANCKKELDKTAPNGFHVDHVFPKSIWPERILDPSNMQLLCPDCNRDKGNSVFRRGPTTQAHLDTAVNYVLELQDLIRVQAEQIRLLEKMRK